MTERTPTAEALEKAREIVDGWEAEIGFGIFNRYVESIKEKLIRRVALALEDFAAQAVKEEREACAMAVENFHDLPGAFKHSLKPTVNLNDGRDQFRWYANAVRARG